MVYQLLQAGAAGLNGFRHREIAAVDGERLQAALLDLLCNGRRTRSHTTLPGRGTQSTAARQDTTRFDPAYEHRQVGSVPHRLGSGNGSPTRAGRPAGPTRETTLT